MEALQSRIQILSSSKWADPEERLMANKDTGRQLHIFKTPLNSWETRNPPSIETYLFILPIRATLSPYHLWPGTKRLFNGTQEQRELDSLNWYCFLVLGAVNVNVRGSVNFPHCSNVVWSPFFLEQCYDYSLSGYTFCPLILQRRKWKVREAKYLETDFSISPVWLLAAQRCTIVLSRQAFSSLGLKTWMLTGHTFLIVQF